MPVFDGAMNAYGYSIGAAPFCDTSRKLSRKRSAANGSKSNSLIRSTSGRTRCTTSATLRIWRRKTSFTPGADSWATSWPADARFSDALNVAKRTSAFGGAAEADAEVSIAPARAVTNNRFILSPLFHYVRGPGLQCGFCAAELLVAKRDGRRPVCRAGAHISPRIVEAPDRRGEDLDATSWRAGAGDSGRMTASPDTGDDRSESRPYRARDMNRVALRNAAGPERRGPGRCQWSGGSSVR